MLKSIKISKSYFITKSSAIILLETVVIILIITLWAFSMHVLLMQILNYLKFLQHKNQEFISKRNLVNCALAYQNNVSCEELFISKKDYRQDEQY